jgi:hypothetical protein
MAMYKTKETQAAYALAFFGNAIPSGSTVSPQLLFYSVKSGRMAGVEG